MKESTREIIETCAHIAIAVAVIISATTLFFYYKAAKLQQQNLRVRTFRDVTHRTNTSLRTMPDPSEKESMDT